MGWFFLFKRVVGMLAQPLTVVFLFLAAGMALTAFTERKKNAFVCLALAGIVLFVCTFPPLVRWQAWPFERLYRPYLGGGGEAFDAVVVLGNGVAHPGDGTIPALSRLNDCSRARLVEGVRLWRLRPEAELIVCGYGMGLENCADAMAEAAIELGVVPERVRRLGQSLDTRHEATLTGEIVGGGKVLVVTTAVHMPRAMAYFRAANVDATAAPCDFIGAVEESVRSDANRRNFRPGGLGLTDSEEIWHEALGIVYLWFAQGADAQRGENDD